jgi:LysR substrate binding domain-containing protein
MPSDHRLTAKQAIHPRELVGEIFIGGANKAAVLRAVTEDYLRRSGVDIKLDHGVDNMAMAMSLVASTRGVALMPAYAKNLLPWSVVSRPLEGDAPTIDIAVGYSKSNTSPILKLFLSRLDELVGGESAALTPPGSGFSGIAPCRPLVPQPLLEEALDEPASFRSLSVPSGKVPGERRRAMSRIRYPVAEARRKGQVVSQGLTTSRCDGRKIDPE